MFEPLEEIEKKSISKKGLIIGALVGLAIIVAIVIYSAVRPRQITAEGIRGASRAGSAEFDQYISQNKLVISDQKMFKAESPHGSKQIIARGMLENRGDRVITGVEVVGRVYDFDRKPITERLAFPIPQEHRGPLKPGESVPITIRMDVPKDREDISEIWLAIRGIVFQ